MSLSIKEVLTNQDRKDFVEFQYKLYKGHPFWVPPMKKDEQKALHPEGNPAFSFCDVKAWIVEDEGKVRGRILALIHKPYNQKVGIQYGRINRMEFEDDPAVFDLLIDTAMRWLKEKGMDKIHGPLGFSNLDTQGLQIEGFEDIPSIASVYHFPYYKDHFDRRGFTKENDWLEFRLTLTEEPVSKANRGIPLIKRRYGFESVEVSSKAELKKYASRIFEILNKAFADLPYVAELNQDMIESYTSKYFDILDPRFITLVKKDDELVGFFIGLPNLSKAMRKAGGKLFPLGFIHIMKELKNPKAIDMMLTGVLPEYQASGVAVILIGELQKRMMDLGIYTMETTGVFETNQNVISNWKNYENEQYKRRRCYVKDL